MLRRDSSRERHVGINAHLLSGQATYRRAGIHHYIRQILQHLPSDSEAAADCRYTIFTGPDHDPLSLGGNVQLLTSRLPTFRPLVRILWEQFVWPLTAVRQRLHLLHSMAFVTPWFAPCPTVVTVYDLSFIHYPDRFPAWQRRYLTTQTRRSCHQARRIVTISESGRQDTHAAFGVPLDRIDVVRPGVDTVFQRRSAEEVAAFRRRENLPNRYLLHVGTLQPRKNIPILLEALARLEQPDLLLVLVGGKGWLYDEIFARVSALKLAKQVRFTGYVSDGDLPLWYNAASLLLFPSVYEGFGLPVAQAMACGTPVIAAETSAIPEVAGSAALFFDPVNVGRLAEQITAVLDNPTLAAAMAQAGLEQSQHFSWVESGRQMAAVYERALAI
jgi:glycosyltransferase involved in cell wall biosynthesis